MAEVEEGDLLADLDAADWGRVRDGVEQAGTWLKTRPVGDTLKSDLATRLQRLAGHPKWEVRKAVAHAVLFLRHESFHSVIAHIIEDENVWVRETARKTLQRRDGLVRTDNHTDNRGEEILGLLSALETRYGTRAQRAALNVADRLNYRFVREAYHEIVRIIAPTDAALLNLERQLAALRVPDETLAHVRRARERVVLITDFLDNLRAFTTHTPAEFTVEALHPIVAEAVDLALSHMDGSAAGIDVRQSVSRTLKIDANRSRLLQALINIVVNAVEACADLGRQAMMTISATAEGETHVRVVIADDGCGMSEEALRDCVLLFSSGKPGGMGFGLPLAKKIIEIDHHGTLSIKSRIGEGTVVTLVLPVDQATCEE
ncbi:MAG: ATP-binding protein [Reyranella sp.]